MSSFDMSEARSEYAASFAKFLEEPDTLKSLNKKIQDALSDAQSEFEYWVQSDMAYNIAGNIQRMAEGAIESILNGDENGLLRRRRFNRMDRGRV